MTSSSISLINARTSGDSPSACIIYDPFWRLFVRCIRAMHGGFATYSHTPHAPDARSQWLHHELFLLRNKAIPAPDLRRRVSHGRLPAPLIATLESRPNQTGNLPA